MIKHLLIKKQCNQKRITDVFNLYYRINQTTDMKQCSLLLAFLCLCMYSFSQKPKINWGDEFKLHKGSTDLEVIYADKSGVYLQESHLALKSYFVIGASARESASLIKVDKNLA